jgi:N-acetylmuramoyl-L-alanine amidase
MNAGRDEGVLLTIRVLTVEYNHVLAMSSAWTKIAVVFFALLLYAQAPEGKRLSVYTAQTGYSLAVVDHDRSEYVRLFEVLEPMGPVSTRLDKKKWRLTFRDTEAEFEDGKTRAKVGGKNFDLADRFFLENNRGMVPLRSVAALVSALTGIPAELRGTSRRLFVGATPVRYSTEPRGNALVITFSKPVNPFIATEQGTVRMVFARDALVPGGSEERTFQDAPVSSLHFEEANGAAEITVGVKEPMIARFSDANRTITLTPVENPALGSQSSTPANPSPSVSAATASQPGTPTRVRRPAFFVLIDPAHGGSDRGAVLSDKLLEKDAVLTLARQLRVEMTGQGIPVKLLRDSDTEIPSDRRAIAVNTAHAAAVIFVHASTVGNGVHVSTAIVPATITGPAMTVGPAGWETAQSRSVNLSRQWADAVAAEVLKRNIGALRMRASVPPLNQTAVPALVLEIAPPPSADANSLFSKSYLQAIMSAVAGATAAQRSRLDQGTH